MTWDKIMKEDWSEYRADAKNNLPKLQKAELEVVGGERLKLVNM